MNRPNKLLLCIQIFTLLCLLAALTFQYLAYRNISKAARIYSEIEKR